MSATMIMDRLPSEVGESDAYNRLQLRRAGIKRGESSARPALVTDRDLLRVLIVDDYRATADTMSKLVRVWGHDVRQTYDGITGLALAATYRPDVMLLDIVMPDVSGLEIARQSREQAGLKQCFIVAVTGRTDAEHRLQSEESGIDLFFVKPVCPSILKELLTWASERVSRSRQDATLQDMASVGSRPRRTETVACRNTDLNLTRVEEQ